MGQFGMGQPVRRVEDKRFITGTGRYTDDIALPNQAYGIVLRSPHAHARIARIDTTKAKRSPGVLGVFTVADLKADKLGTMPCPVDLPPRPGTTMQKPARPILADGRVRFVGDGVAFIVAESLAAARDAAELVEIDYQGLPAIADTAGALAAGAPLVWDDAPHNLCFDWEIGDAQKTDALFKQAAKTVQLTLVQNRLVSNAMEPRNALGDWDGKRSTLYASCQGAHHLRDTLANEILHIDPATLRAVTPDVGGGFGTKIFIYPEHPLVVWAARKLGRPVRWTGDRTDSFLADAHGRDNVIEAALALDKSGRFLALRIDNIANLGAYLSQFGPFIPTLAGAHMMTGVYRFEAAYVRVRGVFTNTAPVDAYRGAGRPEAAYVIERMVDAAARALGVDAAEVRRKNFIRPEDMPHTTALGTVYDSGKFQQNLDDAIRQAKLGELPARRAAAEARGKLRGVGHATYIESCGGGDPQEPAWVDVAADGKITVRVGNQNNGQGHQTAYGQLVADRLGIDDLSRIEVVQGDTDVVPSGSFTGGSRALPVNGVAVDKATERLIEKGKKLAAHYLETAAADIEFADATFTVAGTDRRISLAEVAKRAATDVPPGEQPGLGGTDSFLPAAFTYPNGCHLAEVEIDVDTGRIDIVDYIVVDDFGTIVNPLLLAGQVHGGIAQGVGQALLESCVYEADSGQLVTGSLMDYCMPRADDLPGIAFRTNVVPCTANPLGVKGAGEAGAIGAPPAVVNAVLDALAERGVTHLDMPLTPEKVWRAIRGAAPARAAE
ncbi:MAG TPA: xanthine dehydrogenase family protein molybdopterin-binding subunit [Candidatus Sulfotelmatobacter sp.]|nr:xanthine dehydrogenase family protein molybdopterin-binding subunit [Candidatus Sulfotelmatobacter sp.]